MIESLLNRPGSPKARSVLLLVCVLLLFQATVIWKLHGTPSGVLMSNATQLLLGILCVFESVRAFRRSTGVGRYYCQWLATTFVVWGVAQLLGLYIDATASRSLEPLDGLLFFLSGIPFGMLLFLDSEYESRRFDRLHLLDFLQVCGFWLCVYLYFSRNQHLEFTNIGWGPFGWSTSLIFNGVLALSFGLRAIVTPARMIRTFFWQMALYLFFSGIADSYFSFAPNKVESGTWFDLIWGALLCLPLMAAATWREVPPSSAILEKRGQRIVVNQFFPLVYPFFSLLLIAQMAGKEQLLSSCIGGVIFAAVGMRVLIIQHRLLAAQDRLQFDATHDVLTGLANRRAVLEYLEKELDRQKRMGHSLGLIMADADHFKKINDTYGHSVGDQVLRELGRRMTATFRSYDWVGRYGGEEFLIVIPNCDPKDALASAERLRRSVADIPVPTPSGPIPVTISMGLIATTGRSSDVDCSMLLRMADEALYRAKANGRNRVESALLWGTEPEPSLIGGGQASLAHPPVAIK